MNKISIHLLMALAMFSWAIAWTNAKIVNEYLSFHNLIFLRFLIGFISIYPLIYNKNNIKALTIKNLKFIIPASIIFYIYNLFFFMGTHYGYAGKGAVLVTTLNPIITFIIMSVIQKGINKKEVVGISLGILGGLFIMNVFNEGLSNIFHINNIFFLICAFTWGVNTVITNYGQKNINSFQFIFFCYLFTAIISLPFSNLMTIDFLKLDYKFYFNFFIVSLGAMSFGTSVYLYATPKLGPIKASAFIFSVPFIALGTANIFLGEPITQNVVIGGIISLVAIYIINKK
jgi:drug/metabolite transporter (DMT)-like permease